MHLLVTIQVFNMHAVPCAFDPHKTYICQHSFSLASEPVLIRLIEQLCYMRSAHPPHWRYRKGASMLEAV